MNLNRHLVSRYESNLDVIGILQGFLLLYREVGPRERAPTETNGDYYGLLGAYWGL